MQPCTCSSATVDMAPTGDARWQLGPDTIAGTLNVRLGGKNMTFYQRITARAAGVCR